MLGAFFLTDSLLFRTGWYDALLEPDSSAGQLESHLYWLENVQTKTNVPQVLVVGDSRIAEGFAPLLANSAVGQRLRFWNFGIGGSSPRVWYYALRDLDPTRRRFAAIVIAMEHYSDEDAFPNPNDRVLDQNYLVMHLGLADCVHFALSMDRKDFRHGALFGCLFRGMLLQADVQAFLGHPAARMKHAADWLENGLHYTNVYGGKTEDMDGLSVDWSAKTIQFPDGFSEARKVALSRLLLPDPTDKPGALLRYRRQWLGGILDLYKDSPTEIVFMQVPRAPVAKPDSGVPATFIESAKVRPHVSVIPASTFTDLERPELFADGLHLNRAGRPTFTTRIAEHVEAILSPQPAGGSR